MKHKLTVQTLSDDTKRLPIATANLEEWLEMKRAKGNRIELDEQAEKNLKTYRNNKRITDVIPNILGQLNDHITINELKVIHKQLLKTIRNELPFYRLIAILTTYGYVYCIETDSLNRKC